MSVTSVAGQGGQVPNQGQMVPVTLPDGSKVQVPKNIADQAQQQQDPTIVMNYLAQHGGATGAPTTNPKADNEPSIFTGTGIEDGSRAGMKSKKEYKADEKAYKEQLYNDMKDLGYTEKMAGKHAKNAVNNQKAADRVMSSTYFTPDQKEEYKAFKKNNPNARAVMLSNDDMEMLNQPEFADAWETDPTTGKKTLNSDMVKLIASQRLGSDNMLEMEERQGETAALRGDHLKNGKVTHKQARKTKNFYKHLGFDYQKDLTEWKQVGTIVGSTLLGAGIGGAASKLLGGGSKEVVTQGASSSGAASGVGGSFVGDPTSTIVSIGGSFLPGAVGGAVTGLAGGIYAATKINDFKKDNDILNKRDLADFVNSQYDESGKYLDSPSGFNGVKEDRNQLMMRRIFQMANDKGISKDDLLVMLYRAEGATQNPDGTWNENGDALTERELIKVYNQVRNYEKEEDEEVIESSVVESTVVEEEPEPAQTPEPTVKLRSRAVDEGIVKRTGIKEDPALDANPMTKPDKAQYVLGNEDNETEITGDKKAPTTITIHDNTNDRDGNINHYVYRKITPEEIAKGELDDGTKFEIGEDRKKAGGDFYVLVKADKDDGTDIKSTHVEVYQLDYSETEVEKDDGTKEILANYNLRQHEGMSGYNVSSIDYSRRGSEAKGGAGFKFANWTKQSDERLAKLNTSTTVDDMLAKLVPQPDRQDLIDANPSVFDKDGNVRTDITVNWKRLDLPKGTMIEDAAPAEPATPVTPAEPAIPVTPATPVTPTSSTQPSISDLISAGKFDDADKAIKDAIASGDPAAMEAAHEAFEQLEAQGYYDDPNHEKPQFPGR